MKLALCAALAVLGTAAGGSSPALAQNFIPRMYDCIPSRATPLLHHPEQVRFGPDYWQEIRYYRPRNAPLAPLVINLVPGLWGPGVTLEDIGRQRVNEAGYALAVIPAGGSRPRLPDIVPNHLAALARLRELAEELGFDPERIVILGFGSGAHFATLLGTDESLLPQAGFSFSSLKGVVSFGGTGFDLPRRMAEGGYERSNFRRHVGQDEQLWRALSPASHNQGPNAPQFLFMAFENSQREQEQSQEMMAMLDQAGSAVTYGTYPNGTSCRLRDFLMATEDGAGREVMPFLAQAFAR